MSSTALLQLPLLQASQAQKHVTMNEALVRLDGLAQISLLSRTMSVPPSGAEEGDCYAVPAGAAAGWTGWDGGLAIASNGGWIRIDPHEGWIAWIVDEHARATFLSGSWAVHSIASARNGALACFEVVDVDFEVAPGSDQVVGLDIPKDSMVFACSARVNSQITGSLTSWSLGIAEEPGKFGSGMSLQAPSYCTGILSQPTTFYDTTPVRLFPNGGTFEGGMLRLALHHFRVELPV